MRLLKRYWWIVAGALALWLFWPRSKSADSSAVPGKVFQLDAVIIDLNDGGQSVD